MKRIFVTLVLLASAVSSLPARPPRSTGETAQSLDKANVLPLALDDSFQFRKAILFLNDPTIEKVSLDPMISFQRQRINFGAINDYERRLRYGHYFTFFWRTKRPADVTLRLEYRQQNLGGRVLAQEIHYPNASGSMKTELKIIGDDYKDDGRVIGWRAILIENGRIVGLNQSFLWN